MEARMIDNVPHVRCAQCQEFRSSPMFAMLMPPQAPNSILQPGQKDKSKAPGIEPFCLLCAMRGLTTVLTVLLGMGDAPEDEPEPN